MSKPTTASGDEDPTKLYPPNDPRHYGYSRFQFRLWHGMTTWAWFSLLWGNLKYVSPQRYGLVLSVTLVSLLNNLLAFFQILFYGLRVRRTRIAEDPVLIIGFQRSGTTFLNELLASDERFGFPDTLQCIMPETFLITEHRLRQPNAILRMKQRPMDEMDMSPDAPQEDEIALLVSGVSSPYRQIAFPSDVDAYRRALEQQNTDARVKARWKRAWVHFLRKVQFRSPGKRLLLKSPTHTARIPVILEVFPNAKFIHITRSPYRIYHSNLKLARALTVTQGFELAGVDEEQWKRELLDGFRTFHESYEEMKKKIPDGNLVTVAYEDLVRDPVAVMRDVYDSIDLPDIEPALPAMETYLESRKGYKTNKYDEDPEVVRAINANWGIYFDSYGYDRLPVPGEEPGSADAEPADDAAAPEADDRGHG